MTALLKKMNFKNQKKVILINAPESFEKEKREMSFVTEVSSTLKSAKSVEFFLGFVTKQKEVDDLAGAVAPVLSEDGLLWFAYPKGTSKKYVCEFNRDSGWKMLGELGFEPVRMVAIDEDWSALRFRRVEKIKTMTRSFAMTEVGKKKVAAARKKNGK